MPKEIFRDYEQKGIQGDVPAPSIPREQLPLPAAMDPLDFAAWLALRKEENRQEMVVNHLEIASKQARIAKLRGRNRFLEKENLELGRLTVEVLGKALNGRK